MPKHYNDKKKTDKKKTTKKRTTAKDVPGSGMAKKAAKAIEKRRADRRKLLNSL